MRLCRTVSASLWLLTSLSFVVSGWLSCCSAGLARLKHHSIGKVACYRISTLQIRIRGKLQHDYRAGVSDVGLREAEPISNCKFSGGPRMVVSMYIHYLSLLSPWWG